ncbi:MAG: M50 family metallopeptidase [Candidatus Riflebacteria bacterium]|nr:M50 family metallopeptidase [Candidatus Riflebacteria bacterium]
MLSEKKKTLFAFLLLLVSLYFWSSVWMFPLRLLTVFFHEISHGIAAEVSGGKMLRIDVNLDESGTCWTAGGNRLLVLSAGYLGSLLWGGVLLIIAARTDWDKKTLAALGFILVAVTIFYVRNSSGFAFGLASGFFLIVLSSSLSHYSCDIFLRFLGLTSCLFVIFDIKSDLIDRSVPESDAFKMASYLHLPDKLVGFLWLAAAIFLTYKIVLYSLKKE